MMPSRTTRTAKKVSYNRRINVPYSDMNEGGGILANSEFNRGDFIGEELTPGRLKTIFDNAEDGALFELFETYKKIIAYDTRIGGIVNKRRNAPARYAWRINVKNKDIPQTQDIVEVLEKVFEEYRLKRMIKSASDGILFGAKAFLNNWENHGGLLIPKQPTPVPHARMEMNNAGQMPNESFGALLVTNGDKYWSMKDLQENAMGFCVTPSDDDGFYDIAGVLRPVLKMFVLKYYGLKNWVQYSEIHGYPVSTVKLPRNQYQMFKKEVSNFLSSVGKNRYGVLYNDWEYEISSPPSGKADVFQDLATFCNTEMEVAILGQSATTQMSGGGYSAVTTYKEDEIDNTIDDCETISESFTDGIVKPFILLNYPKYAESVTNIHFEIKVPKKKNFADVLKKYETASRMGLSVSKRKFQEEMDIEIVESGEDAMKLEYEKKDEDASKEPTKRKETRKDGGKVADKE